MSRCCARATSSTSASTTTEVAAASPVEWVPGCLEHDVFRPPVTGIGLDGPAQRAVERGRREHAEVARAVEHGNPPGVVLEHLPERGLQRGIDGHPSEETAKAIRDFEMDKGLVPRGRVSAELMTRLGEPTASKSSSR